MEFDFEQVLNSGVSIKVVGVGGGGNNAVNRMISANIQGVEFIAVNTDSQALDTSCAATKLLIGDKITKGKGISINLMRISFFGLIIGVGRLKRSVLN